MADKDAYYQLVLHPVQAMANLQDMYVTVAKNRLYAMQGRAATNELADRARTLFERDAQIDAFYNDTLAGGKWRHMMDQNHIGYASWNEPPRDIMPRVDRIQVPVPAEMGVAPVELNRALPARRPGFAGGFRGFPQLALPTFDPYLQQTYHLDVYNRGQEPFQYSIRSSQPWLVVEPAAGTVAREQRVAVSVDWSRAPIGTDTVSLTVSGPNEARFVIKAPVFNPATPRRNQVADFVGSDLRARHRFLHHSRRQVGWRHVLEAAAVIADRRAHAAADGARRRGRLHRRAGEQHAQADRRAPHRPSAAGGIPWY